MSQKVIKGSDLLAAKIKQRRQELGLTIEEAASRAGVGMKTWSRYEAGESIRADKSKGVCKALNWALLPEQEDENSILIPTLDEYKAHKAWSEYLEKNFGITAAVSFVVGSDILYDHIQEDLEELSHKPKGTHIGQLDFSWLSDDLPIQFLMNYDYEFLYELQVSLNTMRVQAKAGFPIIAHSVLEELLIYLCNEEASLFLEMTGELETLQEEDPLYNEEWIFDMFDDMDIVTFLYSNFFLRDDHPYHFKHWGEEQFYVGNR